MEATAMSDDTDNTGCRLSERVSLAKPYIE